MKPVLILCVKSFIELEARIHLALMSYLKGNVPSDLDILQQLTQKAKAMEMSSAGSALNYVKAQEAYMNNQPDIMKEAIQEIEVLANKEQIIWLEWHSLELRIKLAELQKLDTQELEYLKAACINKIKQSIPKNLQKEIQLNSAPIAALV